MALICLSTQPLSLSTAARGQSMLNPLMASSRDDTLMLLSSQHPSSASSPIALSDGDSYLLDPYKIGSASGSFQNDAGFLVGGLDAGLISQAEYGFSRPDFRQGPLVGTVEMYERHVFLCYKNPQVWPPRIEAAEFDRLPRLLAAALAARKSDMQRATRLTICEGHDGTETSNGDVLIFPDMIRYRRLTHFDVDTFVDEVLVKDNEWLPGSPETLRGWYVFVCCHGTRDRRCGVCGPSITSKFRNEIESRGIQRKVSVSPCSHIGGHKYAGNVIIFGPNIKKEVTGHWYGYVMPEDVSLLLEQHIGKGEIIDFLWRLDGERVNSIFSSRIQPDAASAPFVQPDATAAPPVQPAATVAPGQMGLSEEDQKKSLEQRSLLYDGVNTDRNTRDSTDTNQVIASMCASKLNVAGCCQKNGGFLCCQSPVVQEKSKNFASTEAATAEKRSKFKKQVSRNNCSGRVGPPRKMCSMPTWYECWECEDTYAALAVVVAAVSVLFAYKCYKQLT